MNSRVLLAATRAAVGGSGTDMYADTDTHTGEWTSFVVLEATVINAITDNGPSPSTVLTAVSIPAGLYVKANGVFTSIDLTSGSVAMTRV